MRIPFFYKTANTGILPAFKLIIILFPFLSHSQDIKTFPKDSLLADFDLMIRSIEEGNPALYNYRSGEETDKIFAAARGKITDMTFFDFYPLFASVISQINDGHTRLLLPPAYQQFILNESESLLPLSLRFIANKIYVFQNYSELPEIKGGEEVIAINGIKSDQLIKELKNYVSADGGNNGFKNRRLDIEQAALVSIKFKFPKNYFLRLRMKNNVIETFQLKAVTQHQNDEGARVKYSDQDKPGKKWEYIIDNAHGCAILTLRDFLNNADKAYFNFLDSVFTDLYNRKIPRLIIDLRENTGGFDGHAAALAGYISKPPFTFYKTRIINQTNYDFLKYTNSGFYNNALKTLKTKKLDNGKYQLSLDWDTLTVIHRPNAFSGKIYILINNRVSSSAASFVAAVCNNPVVKLIGEETGGAYRGSSGATVVLSLPRCKLQVLVPLIWCDHEMTRKNKGIGIQPDYRVVHTIHDYINKNDRQLKFIFELIKKDH